MLNPPKEPNRLSYNGSLPAILHPLPTISRVVDAYRRHANAEEVEHEMLPSLLVSLIKRHSTLMDFLAPRLMRFGGLINVVGRCNGSNTCHARRKQLLIALLSLLFDV